MILAFLISAQQVSAECDSCESQKVNAPEYDPFVNNPCTVDKNVVGGENTEESQPGVRKTKLGNYAWLKVTDPSVCGTSWDSGSFVVEIGSNEIPVSPPARVEAGWFEGWGPGGLNAGTEKHWVLIWQQREEGFEHYEDISSSTGLVPSVGQQAIVTVEYTHTDIFGRVYYKAKFEIQNQYTIERPNILVGLWWMNPRGIPAVGGESFNLQNTMNGHFTNLNARSDQGWALWAASEPYRNPDDAQNPYWACKIDVTQYKIGTIGIDPKPGGAEKCLG